MSVHSHRKKYHRYQPSTHSDLMMNSANPPRTAEPADQDSMSSWERLDAQGLRIFMAGGENTPENEMRERAYAAQHGGSRKIQ